MIDFEGGQIFSKKVVIKNAIWLYLGYGLNKIFKIIIIILSARLLGPEGYGAFNYALSFLGLFFIISDWGISSILVRDFQQSEKKEKIVEHSFTFKIILVLFCALLSITGYFMLNNEDAKKVYFILLITQVLLSFKDFLNSLFKAIQRMEFESIGFFLESLIIFILVVLFLRTNPYTEYLGIFYLLGALFGLIFLLIVAYKYKLIKFLKIKINKENLMYYLKNGTPLMLYGFLGFIFFTTDHLIIGYYRGMYELGIYSVATKIILNLNLLPSIAVAALLPYLSYQVYNKDKLYKIYRKILLMFIIVSFLLSTLILILAPLFINIFLGEKYMLSIPILKILVWAILFLFPLMLLDNIIFVFNKQWLNFYLTLTAAFLNLILNIFLVPYYGAYGAIFATLLSQFLNFAISYYIVEKIIFEKPILSYK